MTVVQPSLYDRLRSAIAAAAITALLGYALVAGLGAEMTATMGDELKVFAVLPDPPPTVRVIPERAKTRRPEGAASPPNLRAKATAIVAPPPIVPPVVPPPIAAALKPGIGSAPFAGAADVRGPGTGSGGQGTGTGSGGDGDGDGGGGDETPPRLLKGRIRGADYPRAAWEAGVGGTVAVRFFVEASGLVTQCAVTRSSGSAELDETTCRLIKQRFRYDPSRDAQGRPVASYVVERHSWGVVDEPEPPVAPRQRR